jgi:hypothetical protein
MNCKSNQELNELRDKYLDVFNENPRLFSFIKNRRRTIARVEREKKKSWAFFEMN